MAQELWRIAHGAKVGAQQRSSACEDSDKSRRSSDARQYQYWAPVLEKFVKGTAAGHLVNLTNPVAHRILELKPCAGNICITLRQTIAHRHENLSWG